jgi:hypothetical protein
VLLSRPRREVTRSSPRYSVALVGYLGDNTSRRVRAIDPTQNSNGITTVSLPVVDDITLARGSRAF